MSKGKERRSEKHDATTEPTETARGQILSAAHIFDRPAVGSGALRALYHLQRRRVLLLRRLQRAGDPLLSGDALSGAQRQPRLEPPDRPRHRQPRKLQLLSAGQPLLLDDDPVPQRDRAQPDRAAADPEIRLRGDGSLCVPQALCAQRQHGGAGRLIVCLFGLFRLQCLFLSLPRADDHVPAAAGGAGRLSL